MMAKPTMIFGVLLILLSGGGELYTHTGSMTVWIPAIFGVLLVLCGWQSLDDAKRKLFMHIAATVGLVGAFGGLGMGLSKLSSVLNGTSTRPVAVYMQLAMGVLCLVFVVLCVRSFIAARKAREAAAK
jgi:hypothetical protein